MNSDIIKKQVGLKAGERIDDLQIGGLGLIQHPEEYCFTTDAVLLANFADVKKTDIVADFCAGSGVIAILLAFKRQPSHIYAVELQPHLADMAARSVVMNGLDGKIEVVEGDIKSFSSRLGGRLLDAVVCNPPYRKISSGEAQLKQSLRLCRHEETVTLQDAVKAASDSLKYRGKLFMVHQAERMAEVFEAFSVCGIEPKRLQIVCNRAGDAPNLILICGIKNGGKGLKWDKPLVMYDNEDNLTAEMRRLYGENTCK